ncbi:hypothetical protein [Pedobacter sp. CFBP9032]|uniref:hypothetical protein n=1 Tax=Pedobacter sp. CFBP9032 TaxID=3096539 RepID=UPI002A6AF546|nr:hypothetical protein [Pedobacter sp. CFBP9032]MDY0906575.1 hypothetical protein [Pedobacter sp. CFBP9032]
MADNNNQNERIILDVQVNSGDAVAGYAQINDAIDDVNKNNSKITNSVKSFKQQLKEAKDAALALAQAGQENSAAYAAAAQRIAELRDQQDVLNRAVTAFDPGKLAGFSKIAGLAASSVAGLQGGMVLLGASTDTASESVAKLQSIAALLTLKDNFDDALEYIKPLLAGLKGTAVATEAVAAATEVSTAATEAQTIATEGATVATNGMGLAFKALGIGLVVAAIAYLVANFKDIKKAVLEFIPDLKGAGDTFNNVKNIIIGVGSVIVNYLIAPIKSAIKLLKGDFKGAIQEMKNGLDVVNNFKKGVAKGEANDAEAARKELLEKQIKATDDQIEVLKARGKATEKLEREQFKRKLELAKEDEDETKKIVQSKAVFEAGVQKKSEDEAKAARDKRIQAAKAASDKLLALAKAEAGELKKYNDEASKIINKSTKTEREKELADIDSKYKQQIELAKKLHKSTADIEEAKGAEKAAISKKYDDIVSAYTAASTDKTLNEFQKRRDEINKQADELLKNATPEQITAINATRNGLQQQNTGLEFATNGSKTAGNDLKDAELTNAPDEKDSAEVAAAKIAAISQAKLDAENAAFALKMVQLRGQQSEIEAATKEHEINKTAIEKDATEKKIALAKAEKEAKLANMETVSGAVGAIGALIGEQTVAGKIAAIATATIDTYVGANKALAQGGLWGFVGAAGVIASGLANIKKILSVKVEGAKGSAGSAPSITPPSINATVLKQAESGSGEITNAINNQKTDTTVKAYIVSKDLETQTQKDSFFKTVSTF